MSGGKSFDYVVQPTAPGLEAAQPPAPRLQRITVIDKTHLKGRSREKLIARIFDQTQTPPEKITITRLDKNAVAYRIGDSREERRISLRSDTTESQTKVYLAIKEKEVPVIPVTRTEKFIESYKRIFSETIKANYPIFTIPLWCGIIVPIWAILDAFGALKRDTQKPFLEEFTPSDPESFLGTLETTNALLQGYLEGQEVSPLSGLGEGILLCKEMLQSVHSGSRRTSVVKKVTTQINESTLKHPLLLPVGYYTGTGYRPVLLSIYKDHQTQKIIVQKFSLAAPDPSHTGRIAAFEEFELNGKDIPTLTRSLIALLEQPETALDLTERLKAVGLNTTKYSTNVKESHDPLGALLGTLGTFQKNRRERNQTGW